MLQRIYTQIFNKHNIILVGLLCVLHRCRVGTYELNKYK